MVDDKLKGWLMWALGAATFAFAGAFVDVVLGWKGAGYGGIIGGLWYLICHKRYKI